MKSKEEAAQALYYGIQNNTKHLKSFNSVTEMNKTDISNEIIVDTTFEALGIKPELINEFRKNGIDNPTEIQQNAIPKILLGQDCVFQSKSGTGKTISFTASLLNIIDPSLKHPQVLICSPTRELNFQISSCVKQFADNIGISVCCTNNEMINETVTEQVVIGCPGKLIYMCNNAAFDSSKVKMIIYDEADQLLVSKNFAVKTLKLAQMMGKSQKVFFSATYSDAAINCIKRISPDAKTETSANTKPKNIQLYHLTVNRNGKINVICDLLQYLPISSAVIFCNTKNMVDTCKAKLNENNYPVEMVHGDMAKQDRDKVVEKFKKGEVKFLVSTDVFSRGMDIPQVNLVINFDIPSLENQGSFSYIHRVGRTGRLDRAGFVIDLISSDSDFGVLNQIHAEMGEISELFSIEELKNIVANSE